MEEENNKERRPVLKSTTIKMLDKFKEKVKEGLWDFDEINDSDLLEIYFKKAEANRWI